MSRNNVIYALLAIHLLIGLFLGVAIGRTPEHRAATVEQLEELRKKTQGDYVELLACWDKIQELDKEIGVKLRRVQPIVVTITNYSGPFTLTVTNW